MLPLMRVVLRKYPKLIDTMAHRHEVYNASTAYVRAEEAAGRAFVLAPDAPLPIKRTEKDPEKLRAVYEMGRRSMEKNLDAMMEFMKS